MIAFQDVTLTAGPGVPVMRHVTCVFPAGRVSSVAGAAGSGKTLLLSAIIGHRQPTSGSIRVDGLDPVTDALPIRHSLCFVARHAPLLPHLTVLEHMRLLVAVAGGAPVPERDIVTALRWSELPDRLIRQRAGALTAFERWSVWLAVHRVRGTSVLLADDPAADLSASETTEAARLLREAVTDTLVAVVTSRDAEFASAVGGDHYFRIELGQMTPRTVRRHLDDGPVLEMIHSR